MDLMIASCVENTKMPRASAAMPAMLRVLGRLDNRLPCDNRPDARRLRMPVVRRRLSRMDQRSVQPATLAESIIGRTRKNIGRKLGGPCAGKAAYSELVKLISNARGVRSMASDP